MIYLCSSDFLREIDIFCQKGVQEGLKIKVLNEILSLHPQCYIDCVTLA